MTKIYGKIFLTLINLAIAFIGYSQAPCLSYTTPATFNCDGVAGGSDFLMSTPGNVDFEFDNMRKYITGITYGGATQLRLTVDELNPGLCKWKLVMYVDNNGHGNEWEPLAAYGSSGDIPKLIPLIQVNVYNGCGTPINSGTYQTFTWISGQCYMVDIIPDLLGIRNMPGSCNGTQVNGPGSYLSDYNEYNFTVDYRIIPGYNLKPGAYQVKIWFCLVED